MSGADGQLFELPKMPETGALGSWARESANQLSFSFAEQSTAAEPLYPLAGARVAMAKKGRGTYSPKDNLHGFNIAPDASVAPVDVVDGYRAGRHTAESQVHRERIERSGGVASALRQHTDGPASDDNGLGGFLRLQSKVQHERSAANKQHGISAESDPLRGSHKGSSAQSIRNKQHGVSAETDIFSGLHKGGSPEKRTAASSGFLAGSGTDDAVFQLINSDGTVQYVRAAANRGTAHKSTIDLSQPGYGSPAADPSAQQHTPNDAGLHVGGIARKPQVPMSAPYATLDDDGGGWQGSGGAGSGRGLLGEGVEGAAGSSSRHMNEPRRAKRYVREEQSNIFSTEPLPPEPSQADPAAAAARLAVHPNSSAAARSIFGGAEEHAAGMSAAAEYDSHFAARYSTSEAAGASSHFLGGVSGHGQGKGRSAAHACFSGSAAAATFDQTAPREASAAAPQPLRSRGRAQAMDPNAAGARVADYRQMTNKGGGDCRPTTSDARSRAPFDTPLRAQADGQLDRRPSSASSGRRARAQPLRSGADADDRFLTTNMANARISERSAQH